ncbi:MULTISPECIES: hypothetical protein [unclassified Marinitoga]|uniref:hypothetical protein n=1 Tax=unclassified Marinitoga TaxID=2640159 RepID=UPI000640FD32|nr:MULTISPECIES: hypothetical protein [unclassified Marinitoga]KLO21712.1 hypothetical protein X274_09905 [Marinitoga sp. 1155]NUU99868.1 hypothetical protein [Marinitoga sp. 1154]
MFIKKKGVLFFILVFIVLVLSSCFKTTPVELLNTNHVSVDLGTNYDIYSKVNASAVELEFNTSIPENAFVYDKSSSIMLVKSYTNKTVVMFSKAQRDIFKGEKLFSIKRNYLNPEKNKIFTKAALLDEKTNRIITKATAPYEDGLSVSDAITLRSGDEASIVIHAKNISNVETFQIHLYYPNTLIDIDTSKGNNGVQLLNSAAVNTLLSDPINNPGDLLITFTTQNGSTLTIEDEDIIRIYIIAKDVNPKGQGNTTLDVTLLDSNLNTVSADTYGGNIVVYDPILLGDFDDPDTTGDERDNTVDIDDFLMFLDHYDTQLGDASYDVDFDIYPSEIAPIGDWQTNSIYSIAFSDGKIDLYDFIIFARNYGKNLPTENSPPVFAATGPTPADGASNQSITTTLDFDDATDPDGDSVTYDVYLGTNQTDVNNLVASTKIATDLTTSITPSLSLDRGATYYWKVVAKDGKGGETQLPGSNTTYSFSTQTLDKIFVAGGYEGVFVIDVSTPANPVIEQDGGSVDNVIDTEGYVYDVAKFDINSEGYVAIADGDKGLKVAFYDDDNTTPQFQLDSSLNPFYVGDEAKGVAYYGSGSNHYILVAAGSQGLYIVQFDPGTTDDANTDDDDPSGEFTLTQKSQLSISGDSKSVTVDGTVAYVAADTGGLVIIDISDVTNPAILGTLSDISNVLDVVADGDYVYVAAGENGVYKVDVSDKTNPSVSTSYNTTGYAESVDVQGDYVYVADGSNGMVKLGKTSLAYVGRYNTDGYAKGIVIDGGTGFIGDGYNGLNIIDVNALTLTGSFDVGSVTRDTVVTGNRYLIVADGAAGVKIYDAGANLANIAAPTLLKTVNTQGYARAVYYQVHDDGAGNEEYLIYVADGPKGIAVINADADGNDTPFENAADITLIGNIDTDGYAYDVYPYATDGNFDLSGDEYLYVADGPKGLAVFDITTQARTRVPVYVNTFIDTGTGSSNVGVMMAIGYDADYDAVTAGNQPALLIADGEAGVVLFDISTANSPALPDTGDHAQDRYDTSGTAFDLYVDTANDYVFIADGTQGLSVVKYAFDGTDALTWTLQGGVRFDDAIITGIVQRAAGYYELAAGNRGVVIMRVADVTTLTNADALHTSGNDPDSDNDYVAGEYNTQGTGYSVNYVGNGGAGAKYYSIVSDGDNGVVILQDNNSAPYTLNLEKDYKWINFGNLVTN